MVEDVVGRGGELERAGLAEKLKRLMAVASKLLMRMAVARCCAAHVGKVANRSGDVLRVGIIGHVGQPYPLEQMMVPLGSCGRLLAQPEPCWPQRFGLA